MDASNKSVRSDTSAVSSLIFSPVLFFSKQDSWDTVLTLALYALDSSDMDRLESHSTRILSSLRSGLRSVNEIHKENGNEHLHTRNDQARRSLDRSLPGSFGVVSLIEIWLFLLGSLFLIIGLLSGAIDLAIGLLLISSGTTVALKVMKAPTKVMIAMISLFAVVILALMGLQYLLSTFLRLG